MVPSHASIQRGTLVSIVLKADQRTGRQVTGQVADLLTRGNHPRGVKVRLQDGRIGRVQSLVMNNQSQSSQSQAYGTVPNYAAVSDGSIRTYHGAGQNQGYGQAVDPSYSSVYESQSRPTQHNNQSPYTSTQPPSSSFDNHGRQVSGNEEGEAFVDPSERSEQVEFFQSYEDARPPTKEERERAQLQAEFKDVDGSLVAAIYGDCEGNLSGCRELLQAISSS